MQLRDWRGRYTGDGDYVKRIGLRLQPGEAEKLRARARDHGRSISGYVRDCLAECWEREDAAGGGHPETDICLTR